MLVKESNRNKLSTNSSEKGKLKSSLGKQAIPQDKMTSPRYMDAQRKTNEISPLQKEHTW